MGPKLRDGEPQNRHLAGEDSLKADHLTIRRNRAASWQDGAHQRSAAPVRREHRRTDSHRLVRPLW